MKSKTDIKAWSERRHFMSGWSPAPRCRGRQSVSWYGTWIRRKTTAIWNLRWLKTMYREAKVKTVEGMAAFRCRKGNSEAEGWKQIQRGNCKNRQKNRWSVCRWKSRDCNPADRGQTVKSFEIMSGYFYRAGVLYSTSETGGAILVIGRKSKALGWIEIN